MPMCHATASADNGKQAPRVESRVRRAGFAWAVVLATTASCAWANPPADPQAWRTLLRATWVLEHLQVAEALDLTLCAEHRLGSRWPDRPMDDLEPAQERVILQAIEACRLRFVQESPDPSGRPASSPAFRGVALDAIERSRARAVDQVRASLVRTHCPGADQPLEGRAPPGGAVPPVTEAALQKAVRASCPKKDGISLSPSALARSAPPPGARN